MIDIYQIVNFSHNSHNAVDFNEMGQWLMSSQRLMNDQIRHT
jgi:hypothetical protein